MPQEKYVKVTYIEALPYFSRDFGAIGAGVTTDETAVPELYMLKNELAQVRFVILTDGVRLVHFASPKAVPKWITKNTSWFAQGEFADARTGPMVQKNQLHEFYQDEGDKIFVRLYSVGAVAASVIGFFAYRMVYEVLDRKPTVFTPVPVRGYHPKK